MTDMKITIPTVMFIGALIFATRVTAWALWTVLQSDEGFDMKSIKRAFSEVIELRRERGNLSAYLLAQLFVRRAISLMDSK